MQTIRWIFWDVGNVLCDDRRQAFAAYSHLYETAVTSHPHLTFATLMGLRERVRTEDRLSSESVIFLSVSRSLLSYEAVAILQRAVKDRVNAEYDTYNVLNRNVTALLRELRRDYQLGIIANQPCECLHSLRRRQIAKYFEVVTLSEEAALCKPDSRLFELALGRARCDPWQAVMIGDREDNDITPARQLGCRTIKATLATDQLGDFSTSRKTEREATFLRSITSVPLYPAFGDSCADGCVNSLVAVARAIRRL